VEIKIHNLRKWAIDKHGTVDDRPYGGGVGMILMIEPIYKALQELKGKRQKANQDTSEVAERTPRRWREAKAKTILLTPQGKVFNQKMAGRLSKLDHLILICGHYEGVDERVRKYLVDEEISIGDYVLTGGELPAMVLVDAIVRLLPGVLEKEEAIKEESFKNWKLEIGNWKLLENPQYTRPANFRGWKVPKILLSGDHQKIAEWRKKQALKRTKERRPDLLKK